MAAALQHNHVNTWTIREEYTTRKMTQVRWEESLSHTTEIVADKISCFIANDALNQLKNQFKPNNPLPNPFYHLTLPPYSLSWKENIEDKPWLLEAEDCSPFHEIVSLVSRKKTSNLLNLTNPSQSDFFSIQRKALREEKKAEEEYLDHLMAKVNELVLNQLRVRLAEFSQNPGNESLQYEVSLTSKYVGDIKNNIHISLWIDKEKL